MKTIVHVNQHVIRANRLNNKLDTVLTVKTYKENIYCSEVIFKGPVKFVYSPDKPLSCGAHVWAETDGEVEVIR